ncbi:Glutamate synthase central domain [Fragilaria crotonensis]|nr:Glutamate synthase central domain [Fragilaria crotonensis]
MFDGPRALVKERDACGVGFIANTHSGDEFGSHKVLQDGLSALGCMEHRGACGGDGVSGDGAGIMTQIPWKLFPEFLSEGSAHKPGVGMIFLPQNEQRRNDVKQVIEDVCRANELEFMGWREVPVDPSVLGEMARKAQPSMWQFFVKAPPRLDYDDDSRDGFERTLYLVRRRFDVERKLRGLVWEDGDGEVYVASFSCRTIVYKGMVQSKFSSVLQRSAKSRLHSLSFITDASRPTQTRDGPLPSLCGIPISSEFDLDEDTSSSSTINGANGDSKGDVRDLVDYDATDNIVMMCNTQDIPSVLEPLIDLGRSDSANLDAVFELMCHSRHRAPCALMALVPTAYENSPDLKDNPEIVDFYKFHGGLLEAWDGPALLVFSDGKSIGASLDRNGLRPARFSRTIDGTVYMMSEGHSWSRRVNYYRKGRLGPGQMINVDLVTGEFKDNIKIKSRLPPHLWLGSEDIGMQIADMAGSGKETTYSMGDDAPIAALSTRPQPLYNYFKQRFAQVTNPPIDPLREGVVMSLATTLGKKESIYKVSEKGARLIHLESPVLNDSEMALIKEYAKEENGGFKQATHHSLRPQARPRRNQIRPRQTVRRSCRRCDGIEVVILSDLAETQAVLDETSYIPPLLAVGAVHHRLIDEGLRMDAGIIAETGGAWSTHHFACLVGYGANAVHPYLALETVKQWHGQEKVQKMMESGKLTKTSLDEAQQNYRKAVEDGLLKILSKMGISLLHLIPGPNL